MRIPSKDGRRIRRGAAAVAATAVAALTSVSVSAPAFAETEGRSTSTPIEHLVVIFQENVSFDHYFGTYPNAANLPGDKVHFTAKPGTPKVDGLTPDLLQHNPNKANPQRLGPQQALTCDQDHEYLDEQKAFNGGRMDQFVEHTEVHDCKPPLYSRQGLVMDYYDGNTVTGLWNYAQRFAMSDNSFATTYGPSTPGALNLVSGQTHGGYAVDATGKKVTDPKVVASADPASGIGTVIEDPDPAFDDCANTSNHLLMTGRNIGDLLNEKKVSWGWFQGGFRPTTPATGSAKAVCASAHANIGGGSRTDYNPHHEPFQYYKSTANQHHTPPASVNEIGHNGPANHQYDLADFDAALQHGNLPAVSYLKAANYQDGHAGYSDPIDEQHFVVDTVNKLQKSKEWKHTAVVIAYDDSDGWYDHKFVKPVNSSHDAQQDALDGPGQCGKGTPAGGYADRCGYGPRLPLLVLSPYAKSNHVDHALTDQSSTLRFIEDNWRTGRIGDASFDEKAGSLQGMFDWKHPNTDTLLLDPATGQSVTGGPTTSPSPTATATATATPTATPTAGSTSAKPSTGSTGGQGGSHNGPLASTGTGVMPMAAAAGSLLAVGTLAVLVVRRKRRDA